MALDEITVIIIVILVVAIAAVASATVILAMRRRLLKPVKKSSSKEPSELESEPVAASTSFRFSKSVQSTDAVHAKDELRILDLEREILADAIRHLYEAHAEGKITEQEREKLASSYKARMLTVKESMAKDETIVALHELESMQEDLTKMFRERLGELNTKVEELRTRIDIKPIKEIQVQMPKTPAVPDQLEEEEAEEEEESKEDKTRKAIPKQPKEKPATPKTEAERRISEMKSKVEEVLNRLDQIEIEREA